jgi:uncharacterized protein YhfF
LARPDWREAHEDFWTTNGARPRRPGGRWQLEDDTDVVVERFRLVTVLPG